MNQGKLDEAVAQYREAMRLKSDDAEAHYNLGNALRDHGKHDEAIAEYREAIRLKPNDADAHNSLGYTLSDQGKHDEAADEFRAAIRLKPDYAEVHYNLGNTLRDQGKPAEAADEYHAAIRTKPDYAEAHCNLGLILHRSDQYAEAIEELRRGHELGSQRPGWAYPSAEWVRQCERMVELDARLPAILKGDDRPKDFAEGLAFGQICYDKTLHAAAARLWADALAADPQRADDRQAQPRYNAACAAALAAAGKGKDDPPPDEAAKAKLRQQALDWLKAELASWSKFINGGTLQDREMVRKTLAHWTVDTDLAGIRDEPELAKLPEAERKDWQALWLGVDAEFKKAEGNSH